jgi:hypothetical protein
MDFSGGLRGGVRRVLDPSAIPIEASSAMGRMDAAGFIISSAALRESVYPLDAFAL